jgi:phospholipase C
MPSAPVNAIEKVVIVFLENHTFDNLASDVSGGDGDTTLPLAPDVVTPDPPHDHPHWMRRDQPFGQGGARRERYGRAQLPNIYSLMDAFTTCDRYFSDVATNSFPNHAFAIGADAEDSIANPHRNQLPFLQTPGVPVRLDGAGKTWANYGNGFAFKYYIEPRMHQNALPHGQFQQDAASGRLPDVSWVYAPGHQDFHPGPITSPDGSSMSASDAWLGSAVGAVATGRLPDGRPLWDHVAVFITFDDWGGWSDHVVPPVVERVGAADPTFANDPYRYGSRVPCVVVSPFAKARYVSHVTSSHASLVAFIERLWGLPPSPNAKARARTTAAAEVAMADCLDLTQAPLPPPVLAPGKQVPGPAKKVPAKKAPGKKVPTPAKKVAAKKVPTPAKKVAAKKVAAKKVRAKKVAAKKTVSKQLPAKKVPAKKVGR